MGGLGPERRSALLGVKLASLVRGHFELGPPPEAAASGFSGGAGMVTPDGRAWVLVDDEPARALGIALAWADRRPGTTELHVLVEHHGGALARRASQFAVPPTVWSVRGRTLRRAVPEPVAAAAVPDDRALALVGVLEAAGATVVIEHGRVTGEVLGLEIAQVQVDPLRDGDGARIEVGVGRHDREAFAMLHGDLPADAALARVVATVRAQRRAAGVDHPLLRLAAERWLRDRVVAEPALVGATALRRMAGTVPRRSVKDAMPAFAAGIDTRGAPVVVGCSVGIDLDLVPAAADARLAHDLRATLVLVMAERDAHPVTRALAAALARPARIVTVAGDWRENLSVP